jgi:hypothetical protein
VQEAWIDWFVDTLSGAMLMIVIKILFRVQSMFRLEETDNQSTYGCEKGREEIAQ